MRKKEKLRNCPVVVSCEKKRARIRCSNNAKKTDLTFAYGHTFRNTPDPI